MVVSLCLTENVVTHVPERKLPAWLGRISYSLYLIHVPIIVGVAHSFPHAPKAALIAIAVPVSLAVAEVLNRLVEAPSENCGIWLARQLRRRSAVA